MIRFLYCMFLFPLAMGTAGGATWYVDVNATGSNTGSSWANAWTNTTDIVWGSISPGATVEIAKGYYSGGIVPKANGASGAPITIQLALDDPNRLGTVTIPGISLSGHKYITINGALSTNYPVPLAVSGIFSLTNNMGIVVTSTDQGIYDGSGCTDLKLLWIHVASCGHDYSQNLDGIHFSVGVSNVEVGYCWFSDNIYGDTVNYNSGRANATWGDLIFHDCILENTGDDMFQVADGTDIYRCYIQHRTYGHAHGHTDCIQTWGNYYRIHHNIIRDFADCGGTNGYNSITYAQFSTPVCGNFLFYDNLVYDDSTNWLTNPGFMLSFDAWWASGKLITNQIITNIVIANNLFSLPQSQPNGWTMYGAATDESRGTNYVHTITNCLVANNIILDCYNWGNEISSGGAWGLPGPVTNPIPLTPGAPASVVVDTNSLPLLNNIVKGPNWSVAYMGVGGNIAAVGAATGMTNNWTNLPSFVAYTPISATTVSAVDDFHLQAQDTIARNRGCNLDAYTNAMPMLNVDLDGNPRDYDGAWDIGPYEYASTDTNLLLWVTFDDADWTKGYLADSSSYGRNAIEYGYGGRTNNSPYMPGRFTMTNAFGTSPARSFSSWSDTNIPATGAAGNYLAVTNITAFANLPQATLCCWGYFDQSTDTNGNPVSWANNSIALFVSAGYAVRGAWEFGRDGDQAPEIKIWTNSSGNQYVSRVFNDNNFNIYGKSDGWHHYAITFSNGLVTMFQDGTNYNSFTPPGVTNLTIAGTWLGIGCNTHAASVASTPQLGDDAYPNNGWMHGKIDDVRIYNRALSAGEIYQVFANTAGATNGSPGTVQPPSALRITLRF